MNDAAMITTDGISMLVRAPLCVRRRPPPLANALLHAPLSTQASLLSQHSSAAYTARCVRISGVYLTYESMTTLIYRILVRPSTTLAAPSRVTYRSPLLTSCALVPKTADALHPPPGPCRQCV